MDHGALPDRLSLLTPHYIASIPADPIGGGTIKLAIHDDGIMIYAAPMDDADSDIAVCHGLDHDWYASVRLYERAHRAFSWTGNGEQP